MRGVLLPRFPASLKLELPRRAGLEKLLQPTPPGLGSSHSHGWEHPEITRPHAVLLRGSRGLRLPAPPLPRDVRGHLGKSRACSSVLCRLGSLWRSQMSARQSMGRGRAPGRAGCAGGALSPARLPASQPWPPQERQHPVARARSSRAFTYLGCPPCCPAAASACRLRLLPRMAPANARPRHARVLPPGRGTRAAAQGAVTRGAPLPAPGRVPLSPPGRR